MLADIAPYVALAALAAVLAIGGVVYWLGRRQGELADRQKAVLGEREAEDIVDYTLALDDRVDNLREAVTVLTEEVERYRHDLDASLTNIAVVRFDAFPDTGGQQSASIALLDNYRSGIVISIIASRESARLYVKFLDHGIPDRKLAPEEEEAVRRSVPTALPRGELSRTPVSTFSRETRLLIDEARRAAAAAQAAVAGEAAAGAPQTSLGTGAPDAEALPDNDPAQLALPRSMFAGPDAELGFSWVEEGTQTEQGSEARHAAAPTTGAAAAAATVYSSAGPAPGEAPRRDAASPAAPPHDRSASASTGREEWHEPAGPAEHASEEPGAPAMGAGPYGDTSAPESRPNGEEAAAAPGPERAAAPEAQDATASGDLDDAEEPRRVAAAEAGDPDGVGGATETAAGHPAEQVAGAAHPAPQVGPTEERPAIERPDDRPRTAATTAESWQTADAAADDADDAEPTASVTEDEAAETPHATAAGDPEDDETDTRTKRVHEDWLGGDELDF